MSNPHSPKVKHEHVLAPASPTHQSTNLNPSSRSTITKRPSSQLNLQSTSYRPRLESSALFTTNTSSNSSSSNINGKHDGVGQKRDDRLALCEMDEEELEKRRGPRYFFNPEGDDEWSKVEPNSSIRLKCRLLPHSSVQALLTGRIHLSPSLLYSIVRPQFQEAKRKIKGRGANGSSGGGSDLYVPVVGEWVTIGVLVEKSPIRIVHGPTEYHRLENSQNQNQNGILASDEESPNPNTHSHPHPDSESDCDGKCQRDCITPCCQNPNKREQNNVQVYVKDKPRKFISFKFLDLGHSSYNSNSISNSISAGKNSLRGDSIMNLTLFESTRTSRGTNDNLGQRKGISETVYTGGSGGAFEKWAKETEGAVVAIVNPRIMPLQKNKSSVGQILTMTPNSASSITLIGRSADYGQCQAIKKDGSKCRGFADKRVSNGICEFHVQSALEKNKSKGGRGEFSNSTGLVTALGNPSDPQFKGKGNGPSSSTSHFKTVKQEKADFGTSFPTKIKQEPGTVRKGASIVRDSNLKGLERMNAPKAYHVQHSSSKNFDPNNPNSFVAGLGEKSLPRSHIKASNPTSLLFNAEDRFGRGRAEKEQRIRQREKNEELLLGLLERKAAGEEDEVLFREERNRSGNAEEIQDEENENQDERGGGGDGGGGKKSSTSNDWDQRREYDQDGTEIIRKRKKIDLGLDEKKSKKSLGLEGGGNQASVFMADSTQAITTGGKAIREAQLEIRRRKEKAEKMKLEKMKGKERKKNGVKPVGAGVGNPSFTARDSLEFALPRRAGVDEIFQNQRDDDSVDLSQLAKIKRRKKSNPDSPTFGKVRKFVDFSKDRFTKRSEREKEEERQRIERIRKKGIAINHHDSGSDLETDDDGDDEGDDDDDDGFEGSSKDRKKNHGHISSKRTFRVRNPIDALRSSSQELEDSDDDEEQAEQVEINRRSEDEVARKDKGKGKERAIDSRPTLPGMELDLSADSDLDFEVEDESQSRRDQLRSNPTPAQRTSSANSGSVVQIPPQIPPKKWSHPIDAVKKMGFDPLAGSRGLDRRRLEAEKGSQSNNDGSDIKSRLLARLSAPSSSLPKPRLNASNSRTKSNLSSRALNSSKEAKEKRLRENSRLALAQAKAKGKGREARVGSDSEDSDDEEFLRDPLLDLDLNLNSKVKGKGKGKEARELDEDGLEIDSGEEWNSELEEELKRAEVRQGKKRMVVFSDDED